MVTGLSGKSAIVTGGARGLGLATAEILSRRGARVALFDASGVELQSAKRSPWWSERDCITHLVDVTDHASVGASVDAVAELWGSVDILINNAAIHELADVQDLTPDRVNRMLMVNVMGVYSCTQSALRHMSAQKSGSIVSVASLAGIRGHPADHEGRGGAAHYAASKGAVIAFTRSVAREVGHLGIRANCVAPGMMATPMHAAAYTSITASNYAATVPLGRIGRPEEIGEAVAFLASDHASYITGQVLNVCGGSLMA